METTKHDKHKHDDHPHKALHVTVHNEDDGDTYRLSAKPDDTLESVVAELYEKKLRRDRQPDDRLRCEGDGEDVFQFEGLTFESYLDGGHCPGMEWLFAGGTGGA